jgi:hypothetical protein
MERSRRETAPVEADIRVNNPDLPALCMALSDWSAEFRNEKRRQAEARRREGDGMGKSQALTK